MKREEYKTRLIGNKFGKLYVDSFYGYDKNNCVVYKCTCECKSDIVVYATYTDLTSGKKDNCGCDTKNKQRNAKRKFNKYDLSGKYGIGWTSNKNSEFYFDLEDYDKIKDYCWIEKDGYIEARGENNTLVKLHRLIMNVNNKSGEIKVDHIQHNKNDNRKSMLRLCTNQQNTMNRIKPKNNTSGVPGVNYEKSTNKWRVRIYYKNKTIHLGRFDNFDDAVKVRKEAEKKYFGEFSYDNSLSTCTN